MPERLSGRAPDQAEGNNWWKGRPERRPAKLLYGYEDEDRVPGKSDEAGNEIALTYDDDLRPAALQLIKKDGFATDQRTASRITRVIRQDLAAALIQLMQAAQKQEDAYKEIEWESVTAQGSVGNYVPRPSLDAKLREATRKPGAVLLYGDAGMGKTTLVKEFVWDTPPTKRVTLHADNDNLLCLELRKELARLGNGTTGFSDSAVKARFSDLLEAGNAPMYVLIDNVVDEQIITDLVPGECRSNVLVMARRRLQHPLIAHTVHVGPMEQEEAAQLALNIAPALGEKAPNLAHWLGRHPLGIQAACGLLANGDLTIDVLSDMLWHDQATIVTLSASESEANLLTIYERMLRQFEQSRIYEPAVAILEAASCVANTNIPRTLLAAYCAAKAGKMADLTHHAIATAGLKLLRDRGLVEYDEDYASLHLLTHALWRKVFDDRIRDIVLTLDPLMRQLALQDVIAARPNRSFASFEELEQYESEHPADAPGGQAYVEQLWNLHYYALVRTTEGKLSPEELEYDPTRGGYGSRVGNLFKYGAFANSDFGKKNGWDERLQVELRYFGLSSDDIHDLIWAPFTSLRQDPPSSD